MREEYSKFISKGIISIFLCLFLSVSSIVSAEKQEWVDKNYDFTKVKRVLIHEPVVSDKLKNGISEHQISEIFSSKLKLPDNAKVVTTAEIVNKVKVDSGIDILALMAQNPKEASRLYYEAIPNYSDIVITSRVFEYSIGSEYREGYTYSTTEYQTAYVNNNRGTSLGTVDMPVSTTHSIPGGNVPVVYASVRWDVYDAKTGKAVISRLDDRARANARAFDNTKPKDLYQRITGAFFDFISDKLSSK